MACLFERRLLFQRSGHEAERAQIANLRWTRTEQYENAVFIFEMLLSWLPNGSELSCGGEQPPQGRLLRGRSDHKR